VYCWSQELKDSNAIKMIMEADKAEQVDNLMKEVSVVRGEENENNIKIMAVTWNMHGGCPSEDIIDELFQKDKVYHDIYVLGTQEAQRPIAQSMMMPSKEKFNSVIMDYFSCSEDG
jgi:hypothetical protein